jgi:hypothetical protein
MESVEEALVGGPEGNAVRLDVLAKASELTSVRGLSIWRRRAPSTSIPLAVSKILSIHERFKPAQD